VFLRGLWVALDQQGQVIHAALLGQHALIARTQAVVFGDDFLELRRETVHSAQDDHVIIACRNTVKTTHGPRAAWQDTGQIVGAVANDWQRFLGQGGDDQFAVFSIGKRLEGFWIHDFWVEVILPHGYTVFGFYAFLSHAR